MRNRKERQNSDRPGGRRGGGSKKSGPGPAPIPAPTGDTQDRAGRGNEKETGGTGALRYRQMFIQSVPGAPERLRDGQIRGLMCLASQGQGRAELGQTTAQVLHKSMKRTIASV